MLMLTKEYIQLGIVTIMFLVFVVFDIKKYRVIKWEKVPKNNQKYIKKREKKINFWVRFGITVFLGLGMILATPSIMDFPAFVTGNYIVCEGKVMSYHYPDKNRPGLKQVEIQNGQTGDVISIKVYGCPKIHEKEILTAKYLKYTKHGVLVNQGENK